MPTDARLTEDRDIDIDDTGDIATVSGDQNVKQQHANALFRAGEQFDNSIADTDSAEDFRIVTRRELSDLRYVDRIRRLEIDAPTRRSFAVSVGTDAITADVEVSP